MNMQLQLAPLSVAVVTALLLVQNVHAHLVLTFPPARDPKYDYLDNYRKGGPCGIPGKFINFGSQFISTLSELNTN